MQDLNWLGDLALPRFLIVAGLGIHLDIGLKIEEDRSVISQSGVISTGITCASEASIFQFLESLRSLTR
jgi:hypothetical protein